MKSMFLHPIPILSIADHQARYEPFRVAGILLGNIEEIPRITNSFALSFDEEDNSFFLDTSYLITMSSLVRKVTNNEKILGWYHTGKTIQPSDYDIVRYIQTQTDVPVITLVVDLEAKESPFQAYYFENDDFVCVNTIISSEEAEEIGIEHLIRDLRYENNDIVDGLKMYRNTIDNIVNYLESAINLGGNNEILYEIQECLNDLPTVKLTEMEGLYVGSLMKSVLRLKDLEINKKENGLRNDCVN